MVPVLIKKNVFSLAEFLEMKLAVFWYYHFTGKVKPTAAAPEN